MNQAVLDNCTPPGSGRLSDDDTWLDMRPPSFAYPDGEELIRIFFTSYLDLECLLAEKTAEWREAIAQEKAIIKEDLRAISELTDERARWFWTQALKALTPAAKTTREALGHVARLQRLKATARCVFGVKSPTGANSDFEELLSRARQVAILDVVSDVLEVRKRGQGYMALCPFHNDKNPSLRIYEDTNTFHCFGCHKGGDAITFVRLHFGYGFRQAVEYLTGGSEDE